MPAAKTATKKRGTSSKVKSKSATSRKSISSPKKIFSDKEIYKMNRETLLNLCKVYNVGGRYKNLEMDDLRALVIRKQEDGAFTTPKKIKIEYQKKYESLALIKHYTRSDLSQMDKKKLLRLCKSAGIKGCSSKTPSEIRKMILEDQKKKDASSPYILLLDADEKKVKEKARRMGVSTAGSNEDIVDRIHKKKGFL